MLDRLRQGFRQALKPGGASAMAVPAAPQTLESTDARLCIRDADGMVEFQPTFSTEPMLRLRGSLNGPLSTGRVSSRSVNSLLHLSLPLLVEGREVTVDVTVVRPTANDTSDGFVLARARRRRTPPAGQAFELLYNNPLDAQVRYLVQTADSIRPVDFHEFSRHESVFKEVPSVSQMVAFLRATLHHRRTTLRSLASMARNATEAHVCAMVLSLNQRLSQGQDFTTDGLRALQQHLSDRGHAANPNTVAALTLLADIFLQNVASVDVDALIEKGQPLVLTSTAMAATACFLGISAPLPEALLQTVEADRAEHALHFLRSTVSRRNALSILTDLADDSGSDRSRSRVDQLLSRVAPDQTLLNDEHVALQSYFEGRGRKIQIDTISALAIYVDFEAGILNEEDIDGLTPQRAFHDASLYSMLAIARAFDFDLRCWLLPAARQGAAVAQEVLWRQLSDLLELCKGGVIARFLEPGAPGHQTMHVASPKDVEGFRARDYTFTGEIMADITTISHLQEADLTAFEAVGTPMVARFVSDSGAVQWRRMDGIVQATSAALKDLVKGTHSFVERYDIFHFGQALLATTVACQRKDLEGRDNALLVYRDARGAAHYKHLPRIDRAEEVTTPPQRDWEWEPVTVSFPDVSLFPPTLIEASHEYLLGLPDDRASLSRLDLVYSGLEAALSQTSQLRSLAEVASAFEQIQQTLHSAAFRALLVGIFDVSARHQAVELLEERKESLYIGCVLSDGLGNPELLELAALLVLHELSVQAGILHDREGLIDLLLDRLLAAAESDDSEMKRCAASMMGSQLVTSHDEQRLAFSYVLMRLMDHDCAQVAQAAAAALGVIALRLVQPPQKLVSIGRPSTAPILCVTDVSQLAEEVLTTFSLPPEHQKPVVTMLATLLA